MDEIKQKLLVLLRKPNPKIPSMGFSDSDYHFPHQVELSINSRTAQSADRPADQDILESVQAAYFARNDDFDICRFELDKLPDALDCLAIQGDFKNLKQQHEVVSKKVLQLILENQNDCNEQFTKMVEIKEVLAEALDLCRKSRSNLRVSEMQLRNSLLILANYRKRKIAQNLLNNLNTIKTLYRTDIRLQELLDEENYSGAIELLLECQSVANTYRHFNCVAALSNKLQETLQCTEDQLDRVLAQTCYYFDGKRYTKLNEAYKLLGKTQLAIDHLHMHYISAIYNTSVNIVHIYIEENIINDENISKKPYKNLCLAVKSKVFIPCLTDLCKSLFIIVLSYRKLVKWHKTYDVIDSASDNIEENYNRQYVHEKLDHNLDKIWQDVQNKVSSLLLNSDLSMYKFDQFVQVLGIVHRLMEVGEEFSGSKSEELQDSIRKQSVTYFKVYHAQRLEELRLFFEIESWTICPVRPTFEILQLHEFKALRSVLKTFRRKQSTFGNTPDGNSSNHSQDGSGCTGNYFIRFNETGTPFDTKLDETVIEENILANFGDEASGYFSEDSEEDEELKKDFVDENQHDIVTEAVPREKREKHNSNAPILTNTTLSVIRQIGKYLQMARLLRPIAYNIIMSLVQLFEYYLYSVHEFFAKDLTISSTIYGVKLSASLKRIGDVLIEDSPSPTTVEFQEHCFRLTVPIISSAVNIKNIEELSGLTERIVAVESLIFLGKQYEFLQEYLEHLVPQHNRIILQQFFLQTIPSAIDLRRPVYMAVIAHAFDLRQILITMAKINWDIKEVMSQHNNYIDIILREIQIFTLRFEKVKSRVNVPQEVMHALWENIAHIVTHTLVEGFSDAKKCSIPGRGLMQLDFAQFLLKFEKMSGVRPVPHRSYVENYVNAFYLPKDDLEKWIRDGSEYSIKHLVSLVRCAYRVDSKSKVELVKAIEDVQKLTGR